MSTWRYGTSRNPLRQANGLRTTSIWKLQIQTSMVWLCEIYHSLPKSALSFHDCFGAAPLLCRKMILSFDSATVFDWLVRKPKVLDHPHVLPVFVGVLLGVILGSLPIVLPGMPAPVRLGLAGGPLIVALILSQVGRIGPLIWYLSPAANLALREIGIVLFLACVGLKSGSRFLEVLLSGSGFYWMAAGAVLTFVPLMIVGLVARKFFKLDYPTLCGVLAGSMTDPPALAFATSITKCDQPLVAYAAVYPLVMILRVFIVQVLVLTLPM
jgi:putative transport protein